MILTPDAMQSSTELIMLISVMYHVFTVRSSEPAIKTASARSVDRWTEVIKHDTLRHDSKCLARVEKLADN